MSEQESLPQIEPVDAPQSAPAESSAPPSAGVNVYDAFKAIPDFQGQDDVAIARNLYQAYTGYQDAQHALQQYQQVIPYAQEYMRNRAAFEKWRESQSQQAAPQPAQPPKWWAPPEVKDTWRSYIVRDPQTGREVIDPSAPFEAQQALRAYQDYTADFARRLVTDPEQTLKPFIEQVAAQKAQELVHQYNNQLGSELTQHQNLGYVGSLEAQNADWLYDQNGQVSPEGQAIQAYISQAAQMGINGPQARWQYATSMLQRDLLNMRYQQMQQPPPQAAPPARPAATKDMQFLRERATRAPNRSGGTTEPRAPRQRMTFEERLKNQLVADGVI